MAALVNNSSGEEQTKKVYFYDDDIINWSIGSAYARRPFANQAEKEAAEEKVNFIHIPTGSSGPVSDQYLRDLSEFEEDYVDQHSPLNGGWYFPKSGVKTSHLVDLANDINENKVSAIVFDFDKTLQLFEGALVGPSKTLDEMLVLLKTNNLAPEKWTKEDLATFILHDVTDENRINNLRITLNLAENKGIPIFIITNNDIPRSNQNGVLTDLFEFLGATVGEDKILGGGTSYTKTKYKVIEESVLRPLEEAQRTPVSISRQGMLHALVGRDNDEDLTHNEQTDSETKGESTFSFGGRKIKRKKTIKKRKKHKPRKKKRKATRKKSILKTHKRRKKKKKTNSFFFK